MAVRFVLVILFLVMVCGSPIQKLQADVTVFEEILKAIEVEDLDLEDVLRAMAKQCQCQGNKCLCCDSISVFKKTVGVCLEVTHALGMFTLKLQVFDKQVWDDEIPESSVRKLIGKSQTVQISGKFGSVSASGTITFNDIQMTPENVASSCVDGKAVIESRRGCKMKRQQITKRKISSSGSSSCESDCYHEDDAADDDNNYDDGDTVTQTTTIKSSSTIVPIVTVLIVMMPMEIMVSEMMMS